MSTQGLGPAAEAGRISNVLEFGYLVDHLPRIPSRNDEEARTMAKHKKRRLNPVQHQLKRVDQSSKKAKVQHKLEATIPFGAEDRILLVGEGDFSFARSIIENHGCCDVTATCFDSEGALYEKYKPQAERNVQFVTDEGQTVLYSVDATKLDSTKALRKGTLFDRILFNFPHVGGKTKDVNRQVRFNQELLVKFFTTASSLIASDGTIIVTLFEGEPYTLWNIRDLARHSGLEVKLSFKFMPDAYPGYHHARTLGNIEGGGGWKGDDRDARSYVFRKKSEQQSSVDLNLRKRKQNADESSSGEDE